MLIHLNSIRVGESGLQWQQLYKKYWPAYQKWFLSEGQMARPGYTTSFTKLCHYMPEIIPVYEQLVALAGNGDMEARFLSQYMPPPYLSGCSQVVWTKTKPALIRNYDFSPELFEGVLLYTRWLRPVIAVTDCLWGVLDGINDAGLAVCLSFGGRKMTGDGFGITLLLRYVLETCESTNEAREVLKRIPVHMPYNVTLADQFSDYATAYLAPDREPQITNSPICTNHQQTVEWEDYVKKTQSVERKAYLEKFLANEGETKQSLIEKFLKPPLYKTKFRKGMGTLYTAVYNPVKRNVVFYWPGNQILKQSFKHFEEGLTSVNVLHHYKSKLTL